MNEYLSEKKYEGPLFSLDVAERMAENAKRRGIEYVTIPGF